MRHLYFIGYIFACGCAFALFCVNAADRPMDTKFPGSDKPTVIFNNGLEYIPDVILVEHSNDAKYIQFSDVVRLELKTGKVEYLNGAKPDEAAKAFWHAVEIMNGCKKTQ